MEGALDSEILGSGVLSKRRFPRCLALLLTSSAAVAVEVFLRQSYFGWGGGLG